MTDEQSSAEDAPKSPEESAERDAGEKSAGEESAEKSAEAGESADAGEKSAAEPAETPAETQPAETQPAETSEPKPEPRREIAPGVPRLGTPVGAASVPPDLSPGYGFLAVVSLVSLVADLATKVWAKERLEAFPGYITVWEKKWTQTSAGMSFILAHNKGGAWGLLQGTNENVRKPFFLLVSAAAIAFIVTLFRRLQPGQRALKWGLPLVLGGALGNVFDRIRYGSVIDFIDVHVETGGVDHHWPTFNVADIAICVGVGLMAVDMFTSKRREPPPKRRTTATQTGAAAPDEKAPAAAEGGEVGAEDKPAEGTEAAKEGAAQAAEGAAQDAKDATSDGAETAKDDSPPPKAQEPATE